MGTDTLHGKVAISMRTAGLASLTALVLAFTGGTAMAQDGPSQRGYDETLGVIGQVDTPQTPTRPAQAAQPSQAAVTPAQPVQQEGSLPFTGLDIGIVALMGIVLLGTGVVLRRTITRGPSS
jgi:hypothetical protein